MTTARARATSAAAARDDARARVDADPESACESWGARSRFAFADTVWPVTTPARTSVTLDGIRFQERRRRAERDVPTSTCGTPRVRYGRGAGLLGEPGLRDLPSAPEEAPLHALIEGGLPDRSRSTPDLDGPVFTPGTGGSAVGWPSSAWPRRSSSGRRDWLPLTEVLHRRCHGPTPSRRHVDPRCSARRSRRCAPSAEPEGAPVGSSAGG
jgi:hypothetical protein